MANIKFLVSLTLLTTAAGVCWADSSSDLNKENAELRSRIEKLEEYTKKKNMWSDLDIQLYGYIKLDASYDNSRTTAGNYIIWADQNGGGDNEFNMTANETRLGLRINGPEDSWIKTSGRIEIDFYGSGADENKAKIQMRHAYLEINWPQDRFSILAGQTSDVMSPLNPATLNYTVLWNAGNIGYRRPQLRLTKDFMLENDVDLKLEGALARTIGDDETSIISGEKSGEDAGFPTFEGRFSLMFPWFGYKPTTVGFSGHWGQEEYGSKDMESWSLNLDVTQPVNKWLAIKGEAFTGENLDTYLGGIGQGVRKTGTVYDREIGSTGGWFAAGLGPWDKWSFNIGAGIDDVDNDDVITGYRTLNHTVFGNAIYTLNKNTDIGMELSHWRTGYKGPGDTDDLRVQASVTYKF